MLKTRWIVLSAVVLGACVAHEKAGDSAAAVGDWRTAYSHYRQAVTDKPDAPGLKDKYEAARREAAAQARQRAHSCEQQRDWSCVLDEATWALDLEPGDAAMTALRERAIVGRAFDQLAEAREATRRHEFERAVELLRAADQQKASAVQEEIDRVHEDLVGAASKEAARQRLSQSYAESIRLYRLLVSLDPRFKETLQAVEIEHEDFIRAQYAEHVRRGDDALEAPDFGAAEQAYRAASQLRPGGPADVLAEYAANMNAAARAMSARDFATAERALRDALATRRDRGYAAEWLERVQIRPYVVSIATVLVQPSRPNETPWVGRGSPLFFRLARVIERHIERGNFGQARAAARTLPYENRPDVRIEAVLADGTRLTTGTQKGIYESFESNFVLDTNSYDERRVAFRVLLGNAPPFEEVTRTEISYGELAARGAVTLRGTSSELYVNAKPARGRHPALVGMTPVNATPPVVVPPAPPPGRTGSQPIPASGTPGGSVVPAGGNNRPPPPAGRTGTVPASTTRPPPPAPTNQPAPAPAQPTPAPNPPGAPPSQPAPAPASQPPSAPAQPGPTPTQPTPTQPAPTQPTPTQPTPTQPAPTQPTPTQPAPAPTQPTPSPNPPAPSQPGPVTPPHDNRRDDDRRGDRDDRGNDDRREERRGDDPKPDPARDDREERRGARGRDDDRDERRADRDDDDRDEAPGGRKDDKDKKDRDGKGR